MTPTIKPSRVVLVEDLMQTSPSEIKRLLDNLATKFYGKEINIRIIAEIVEASKPPKGD
jgi:hypothetical protein